MKFFSAIVFLGLPLGVAVGSGVSLENLLRPVELEQPAPPATVAQTQPSTSRGASGSKVQPTRLEIDDVQNALARELTRRFEAEGELRVMLTRGWTPVELGSEDWFLEVMDVNQAELDSSLQVRFRIGEPGRRVGEWSVPIRVRQLVDVWVPLRGITRGASLQSDDFEVRRLDVLSLAHPPIPANIELNRMEAQTAISPGRPVLWRDVATRPAVRRNQVVDVLATSGPLTVSMKGQVQENGVIGQMVTVRNLQSRREFQAQVIDESTVQVYF